MLSRLTLKQPFPVLTTAIASSLLIALAAPLSTIAAPTALIAQSHPLLAPGSTGAEVRQMQATLKLLGFYQGTLDGSYTAATQEAVLQFQSAAGIAADGIVGPTTWNKLLPTPETSAIIPTSEIPAPPAAAESAPAAGPPILRPGIIGPAVAQLQKELTQLGYYKGEIDSEYGNLTQAAVKIFQADRGLEVDAIVGPSTWNALTQALGR